LFAVAFSCFWARACSNFAISALLLALRVLLLGSARVFWFSFFLLQYGNRQPKQWLESTKDDGLIKKVVPFTSTAFHRANEPFIVFGESQAEFCVVLRFVTAVLLASALLPCFPRFCPRFACCLRLSQMLSNGSVSWAKQAMILLIFRVVSMCVVWPIKQR
jgi:hypothetical protein